eukprot:scaffold145775_cov10-Tisochrysis_lutea.AAC.1
MALCVSEGPCASKALLKTLLEALKGLLVFILGPIGCARALCHGYLNPISFTPSMLNPVNSQVDI